MLLDKKKRVIYDKEIRECIDAFESWVVGLSIFDEIDYDSRVEGRALKKEYYEFYSRKSTIDLNSIVMKIREEKGKLDKITFCFSLFDYWSNANSAANKIIFIKKELASIGVFGINPVEKLSSGFSVKFEFNIYDSNRIVKVLSTLDEIMVELINWDIGS